MDMPSNCIIWSVAKCIEQLIEEGIKQEAQQIFRLNARHLYSADMVNEDK